jgi:hypothetical protein
VFVESAPFRSATSDVKAKASASLHGEVTKQTTWLRIKMNDQLRAAAAIRLGPRVTVGLPFSEAIPATGAASSNILNPASISLIADCPIPIRCAAPAPTG